MFKPTVKISRLKLFHSLGSYYFWRVPQIYYQQILPDTQLVVWHITEPEQFFESAALGIRSIAHPHKRLQHLCGRYLLLHLVAGFPVQRIVAEHNNKPFLQNHPYHFSISHCDDYVAAVVSTTMRVGVDVETVSPKVVKIRHKFLTAAEEEMLKNAALPFTETEKLTLAWSMKETMFKWLGETGVDFKTQLVLKQVQTIEQENYIAAEINRATTQPVNIKFLLLNEIVLSWLTN